MNAHTLRCNKCGRTYTTYTGEDKSCPHCGSIKYVYLRTDKLR